MAGYSNKLLFLFLLCVTFIMSDESFKNKIEGKPEKTEDSSSALCKFNIFFVIHSFLPCTCRFIITFY